MKKLTLSDALYATISSLGMVLTPLKPSLFLNAEVFLQPRYSAM